MPLVYLSCAWVAGIFFGSQFHAHFLLIFTGLIPLLWLLFTRKHWKSVLLLTLCLIAFFSGIVRFQSTPGNELQPYHDQRTMVSIQGTIDADPEVRDRVTYLRLKATAIEWEGEWREVSGTVLLTVPRYSVYEYGDEQVPLDYGDELQVTGKLETPPQLEDFNYQDYLAHQGIYSVMRYPRIEIAERGKGSPLMSAIYSLRDRLSQTLAQVLPEPQAALAQGIILGLRSNIPAWLNADFSRTGTAHLLAISGLHISIVAGILLSLGLWLLGRRHHIYIWLALGTVWLYALITGMHAPAVRSVIMASMFLIAELLGRQRHAMTALCFAAAVMVGINPLILWGTSFQMTFLAMAGLIFLAPALQAGGRKLVNAVLGKDGTAASIASMITDSLSVTLSAIIFVWPLVAYYFGIISWVGLPATFLALPVLPAIIITGALTGGLGFIALPAAQVIGWLAWLFLSYLLLVVKAFAAIPLSSISSPPGTTLVWVYYLALALGLYLASNKKGRTGTVGYLKTVSGYCSALPKKWVIPPLVALAILTSAAAGTMPDNNLHVTFLDVGQGDAILIQSPAHQTILVDGGPSPQQLELELGRKMPFWNRTIDLLVLTHPHADHAAGLVQVLARYHVNQVLYTNLSYESPLYEEFLRLIREKNINCTLAQRGQQVNLGEGGVIEVLHPPAPILAGTESDIDNNSMVLRVVMGRVSFLLAADIYREAELELITRCASLTSTVLKVPHHGSDTATTPEFLAAVNPRLAVISVGTDNRFGLPHRETMDRLKQKVVYRTDEHGTIEFITNGERLWVKTER